MAVLAITCSRLEPMVRVCGNLLRIFKFRVALDTGLAPLHPVLELSVSP